MIRLTDLAGKGSFTMGGKKFEYGKVYSNPYTTAFASEVNEAKKIDVTKLKKGDEITINMGKGNEKVKVLSNFKAGVSKYDFISLGRKGGGAPYTITLSRLEKVIKEDVNEAEGSQDHEVSMAQNQLDSIIKSATELKQKMGEEEKQIPAWIQDHITNSENYISQAASNYHEYGDSNEGINEASDEELVKNMQKTIKDLETKLRTTKDSKEREMIKKNIAVNTGLLNWWKTRKEVVSEAGPCWKGYQQVGMKMKNGKEVPNCVPKNESITEAGRVPKMYVKYMAVQKKVKELEDKQKVMAAKYFAEKDPKKKEKMMPDLKKGTAQLASYRRNLADIEEKYVTGLYSDAEYQGE